jgi:PAS domain S-box-containing protein
MPRTYAYTSQIWPPVLTVLLLIVLAIYAWRQRVMPGALPFMIGCLFAAMWMAGSVMEYLALEGATKLFWVKFQVSFQLPYITAITCFFLEYTWPGRWLTRRNITLLSIPPLLVLGLILTNNLHRWIWRDFIFEGTRLPLFGVGAWFAIAYAYGLAIVNIIASAWLFFRSPQHRLPVACLLAGLVMAYTTYLLQRTYILQPDLLLDVLAVAFANLMFAVALFGFRIFDPISLAHKTAIEQLQAGILVLDPQGRIMSLNPAAERIFEAPASRVKGRFIDELLPAYSDGLVAGPGGTEIEIDLKSGQEICHYSLVISLLKDWRGLEVGRLLLLRDITEQQRNQAQLLEQQRALAILNERERLARELHDGLGQTLAATHLQASTAKLLFARGEAVQLSECLDILADTTLQAEADVREYLLGAQSVISADHLFFATLREYLKRFTRQYSLPVELSVLPELEGQDLPQTVALQLLRIIQEALSNVRKHARATSARLAFTVSGELLQISICDNGQGFEPTAVAAEQAGGYGLRSMRVRAEELGGCLKVISHPGRGTQVIVKVPVTRER